MAYIHENRKWYPEEKVWGPWETKGFWPLGLFTVLDRIYIVDENATLELNVNTTRTEYRKREIKNDLSAILHVEGICKHCSENLYTRWIVEYGYVLCSYVNDIFWDLCPNNDEGKHELV